MYILTFMYMSLELLLYIDAHTHNGIRKYVLTGNCIKPVITICIYTDTVDTPHTSTFTIAYMDSQWITNDYSIKLRVS